MLEWYAVRGLTTTMLGQCDLHLQDISRSDRVTFDARDHTLLCQVIKGSTGVGESL
jgi:hypothetical protein